MIIKPEDKYIRDLLKCGATFTIPRFQREYSWDKANYKEFFEDMIKSLEVSNDGITVSDYFLGTMLFVGELKSGNEVEVVDGQQRLTTITILFSAISDHFKNANCDDKSKYIFDYIMGADDDGKSVRRLKTKTNYPYFAHYIQDRNKSHEVKADSEEEICIFEAYEYLYNETSETKLRNRLKKGSVLIHV